MGKTPVGLLAPRTFGSRGSRGHDHPADLCGNRHDRPFRVPQVAGDEFPFQFHAGDEKEDRQQPVARPLCDGQVQMQCRGPISVASMAK